jgi:succinate dehydrogenase / fumarate reductase, cytochrome b subunit
VGTELWLVRAVLIAAVVGHVVAAVQLTRQKEAARPQGYHRRQPQVSSLASRTIRWGGLLLLVFIVLHVLHFTVRSFPGYQGTVTIDGVETVDVYTNLVTAFQNPLWVAFYVVSMVVLGLHLYHGVWSSMRTLGAAKPSATPLRRQIALGLSILIWAGFTIVPIGIFLGLAR